MADETPRISSRAESIDVLRGFAALAVLSAHVTFALATTAPELWEKLTWMPIRIIWSGHQAVVMFFVLSGFALTRMIENMGDHSYHRFIAARIARIYPPYIFSIIYTLCIYFILSDLGFHWNAGWMFLTLKPHLTEKLLIGHITMIGVFGMMKINSVVWSLVHEMRLSIAFPIILLAVRKFGAKAVVAFICTSLVYVTLYWKESSGWPSTVGENLLATVHYATFFAMGSWVAINIDKLVSFFQRQSRWKRICFWFIGLALYTYCFNGYWNLSRRAFGDIGLGFGASILVILSFTVQRGMIFYIGKWLGKISYSLYLTHYVLVAACAIVLYKQFGGWVMAVSSITLSLLIAAGVHRFIERPAINFSRRISRRKAPINGLQTTSPGQS